MTHICVSDLTNIGSDNGLSPGRRQAITWTNDGILLIRTLGTNFSEILSETHSFSFWKMHLKMSSAKWRLFCLGLNELTIVCWQLQLGRRLGAFQIPTILWCHSRPSPLSVTVTVAFWNIFNGLSFDRRQAIIRKYGDILSITQLDKFKSCWLLIFNI